MKNDPCELFRTNPHGAQAVNVLLSESVGLTISQSLFSIEDLNEKTALVLTGEEMDSLFAKWREYRERNP